MSSGIKSTDSNEDKYAKVLPADVTAAFLSVKAGIDSLASTASYSSAVIYSFLVILAICPFYFRILMSVKSAMQNLFLCVSFVVFGLSIASQNLIDFLGQQHETSVKIVATVAPILWAFLITPMFIRVFGNLIASEAASAPTLVVNAQSAQLVDSGKDESIKHVVE